MSMNPRLAIASPDQVIYFLHIPKTAGTTFRIFLENAFHESEVCPEYDLFSITRINENKLLKYKLFRGHMGYGLVDYLPQRPFVLTMIRDPVDRAISHFNYISRDPNHPKFAIIRDEKLDLLRFLQNRRLSAELENMQTKNLSQKIPRDILRRIGQHATTPLEFRVEFEGARKFPNRERMLDIALARLEEIEFVGLVNRFDDALLLAAYQLQLRPQIVLQSLNVTDEKEEVAVPEDVLALIQERNDLDTRLYERAEQIFAASFKTMVEHLALEHYDRIMDNQYKPLDSVIMDFQGPLSGIGWQQREHDERYGFYRWTGPTVKSTIDMALTRQRDYRISIGIIDAVADDVLASLRLSINDQELATEIEQHGDSYICRGILPRAWVPINTRFRLVLEVNRTERSKKTKKAGPIDHNEGRRCGLAINSVIVQPKE